MLEIFDVFLDLDGRIVSKELGIHRVGMTTRARESTHASFVLNTSATMERRTHWHAPTCPCHEVYRRVDERLLRCMRVYLSTRSDWFRAFA